MTTIRISHETKELLDTLKHHPKESYEDVIERLAAREYDDEPLSGEEIADMKASLADIRAGSVRTLQSIRKKTGVRSGPKARSGSMKYGHSSQSGPPSGVRESSHGGLGGRRVETLLSDIVAHLDRIEEKIDENVYPPESAMKPEFVRQVKKARADIKKGKGKSYNSIEDFFKDIEA
jgi:predicted CopG family antitoxin